MAKIYLVTYSGFFEGQEPINDHDYVQATSESHALMLVGSFFWGIYNFTFTRIGVDLDHETED